MRGKSNLTLFLCRSTVVKKKPRILLLFESVTFSETGGLHVFSLKLLIMLFNVTCRELAHQMGWSSFFSICYVCWELGTTLLLWGITAQAVGAGSDNAWMSKKLICIQPASISRGAIKNATPPLLKEGCVLVPCPANSCLWWENYRWYRVIMSINSGRNQCRRVSSCGRQRAASCVLAWTVVSTSVQESLLVYLQINK